MHFERGRNYERAVHYLHRAGENAIRRSANQEAIGLLNKGLELLTLIPDAPEHAQQELMLQIAIGGPLMATQGYASVEVEKVYSRALELCRQVGETPQLFPVLKGLYWFYVVRGTYGRHTSWGNSSCAWPKAYKTQRFSWTPTGQQGLFRSILETSSPPEPAWNRGLPSMILSTTTPMPFFTGRTLGCSASPMQPGLSGFLAIRTKP